MGSDYKVLPITLGPHQRKSRDLIVSPTVLRARPQGVDISWID